MSVLEPQPSLSELERLIQKYPIPQDFHYAYGTAGFRYKATLLEPVFVRTGILAGLLEEEIIGIMITASHNDESYNGIKISASNGGMMNEKGEALAVQLANDPKLDVSKLQFIPKVVHVGRDTRSHSPALAQLLIRSMRAAGMTVVDHGVVSTPMLHHIVLHANPQYLPLYLPPRPGVNGYYSLMADSYMAFNPSSNIPLVVDCACGVGYPALSQVLARLKELGCQRGIILKNAPSLREDSTLNEGCGSEYVQKKIAPPNWYDDAPADQSFCASLDGDADRIVFFSNNKGTFRLLDGDKIACLLANFCGALISRIQKATPSLPKISLGVVQTAYANGASTKYLEKQKITTRIAKTGVKHVHKIAAHDFDVGIYFEANGHGTVLFNPKFGDWLYQAKQYHFGKKSDVHSAITTLHIMTNLINPAVGDAISDLLVVDSILQLSGQSIDQWDSIYQDMPSRQEKVQVKDRSVIETNDNETKCLKPAGVQQALDKAMRQIGGRCFIRPSGTEDVVRVYAEANNRESADALCREAINVVQTMCGGLHSKM